MLWIMNDSSRSSSNTEMNGQLSFDDMTNDSVVVTPQELAELIGHLVDILLKYWESPNADS